MAYAWYREMTMLLLAIPKRNTRNTEWDCYIRRSLAIIIFMKHLPAKILACMFVMLQVMTVIHYNACTYLVWK